MAADFGVRIDELADRLQVEEATKEAISERANYLQTEEFKELVAERNKLYSWGENDDLD